MSNARNSRKNRNNHAISLFSPVHVRFLPFAAVKKAPANMDPKKLVPWTKVGKQEVVDGTSQQHKNGNSRGKEMKSPSSHPSIHCSPNLAHFHNIVTTHETWPSVDVPNAQNS
jgi:hypothetical protein